jgi:hypothetical protein
MLLFCTFSPAALGHLHLARPNQVCSLQTSFFCTLALIASKKPAISIFDGILKKGPLRNSMVEGQRSGLFSFRHVPVCSFVFRRFAPLVFFACVCLCAGCACCSPALVCVSVGGAQEMKLCASNRWLFFLVLF